MATAPQKKDVGQALWLVNNAKLGPCFREWLARSNVRELRIWELKSKDGQRFLHSASVRLDDTRVGCGMWKLLTTLHNVFKLLLGDDHFHFDFLQVEIDPVVFVYHFGTLSLKWCHNPHSTTCSHKKMSPKSQIKTSLNGFLTTS